MEICSNRKPHKRMSHQNDANEPKSKTIRLCGPSTSFDLAVRCPQLSLASLATELLLRAAALPDFTIQRSGNDSDSVVRFMVARFAGRVGHVAEFILDDDEIVVAHISAPSEWSPSERATACATAFAELFSAVRTSNGGHVTVTTVPLT